MASDHFSSCDLLIIGAGPSGLMAAAWAAQFGIHARIVDKRESKVLRGQADGLQCRTMEIFDSFGFAERILEESNPLVEVCFWNPDEAGAIHRTDRFSNTIPGISRFQEVVLHQGRIEQYFLDFLNQNSKIEVERSVLPLELELDSSKSENQDSYPIKVKVQHLGDNVTGSDQKHTDMTMLPNVLKIDPRKYNTNDAALGSEPKKSMEIIRAKYMIGCDGAHSWTRQQLGFTMDGEQTDSIWGVLDIIPITDFPDIRSKTAIHSASAGTVMVIPREKMLVRLYIQLNDLRSAKQVDRSTISPEIILKAAQKILRPYRITYNYCDWWTAYQIGQRIGNLFSADDRIFLAGDAVHTHSPKAGQGMNVSIQDTYNLGWKIGAVISGFARRSILRTYQLERRTVAQDLIEFDRKLSYLFTGKPARDAADETGISMQEFKELYRKKGLFTAGLAVDYGASVLVAKPGGLAGNGLNDEPNGPCKAIGKQELAMNIPLGKRFPSHQVLGQSDARPWQFAQRLPSDGRFRIILFAGNLNKLQWQRVQKFGADISAPNSILRRYTPSNRLNDAIIDVLMIHSAPRKDIELLALHEVFHPFDAKRGWNYEKVFVDDESYHQGHGEAYRNYGVDRERGCVVITRPDQYVGWIGELEDVREIECYFSGFLIPQA